MMRRGVGTIHRRLSKMEHEGPEGRHDNKSLGRPRFLSPEQEHVIGEDLARSPRESGFGRGSWNAKMLPDAYWNGSTHHTSGGRP